MRTNLCEKRLLNGVGVLGIRGVGLIVDQARPDGTRLPPEVRFSKGTNWLSKFGSIVEAYELLRYCLSSGPDRIWHYLAENGAKVGETILTSTGNVYRDCFR